VVLIIIDAQRISPFDDDFGVFPDKVVLVEDEQRPVTHSFEAQSSNKPTPSAAAGYRRRRGEDVGCGLVSTGESRPLPGSVHSAAVTDPSGRDRRRPDNNIHRNVESDNSR